MPYDSYGTFTLVSSYFVEVGDDVLPSQHNPPFQDVAAGLSFAVLRDGRAAWTGNQNAGGYKLTGLLDGTNPQDAATVGQAAYAVGDFKDTARTLDENWLKRDGSLYATEDYPDLAVVLPALPDGVDWSNRVSGTTAAVRDIVHDGVRYVGVGGSSVVTSTDGENWILLQTIAGAELYGIAFGNGIYLAVDVASGKAYTSPDAETWSDRGVKNASGIFGVCYSAVNSTFVLVGAGGYVGTTDDGVNYTTQVSGTTDSLWRIREVNSVLIAVGNAGEIITSSNMTAWTARTSGTTERLNDVTYFGGTYAVVGNSGVIRTSTNLTTWTARTSGVSSSLNTALASSSGFMAAGADGVVRISSDATTWATSATGITGTWQGGIVSPNNSARYILGGPSQTIFDGIRTLPTQFRVPDDDPDYGWIRALP